MPLLPIPLALLPEICTHHHHHHSMSIQPSTTDKKLQLHLPFYHILPVPLLQLPILILRTPLIGVIPFTAHPMSYTEYIFKTLTAYETTTKKSIFMLNRCFNIKLERSAGLTPASTFFKPPQNQKYNPTPWRTSKQLVLHFQQAQSRMKGTRYTNLGVRSQQLQVNGQPAVSDNQFLIHLEWVAGQD